MSNVYSGDYIQIGNSATATQNFVLRVPATPDGTLTLKRGNVGSESETEFSISSAGVFTFPQAMTVTGDGSVGGRLGVGAAASASYPLNLVQNDNNFIRLYAVSSRVWRIGASGASAAAGIFSLIDDSAGLTRLSVDASGVVSIPGTLGVTGVITPGQTTGIVGTTTNNSVQAGSVGEYVSSVISVYTSFPATGVFGDLTSISLTAGDWDVTLSFGGYLNASANWSEIAAFIGTVAGNSSVNFAPNDSGQYSGFARSTTSNTEISLVVPAYRVSISGTTTYYLKMYADYTSGGPPVAKGRISARRVR